MTNSIKITEEYFGERLDKAVAALCPDLSRSLVQSLCENGNILLNNKPVDKKCKLKAGDIIEVTIPNPEPAEILPENIPLEIVYEDEHLLVVNKPKGMVVHPAPGNYTGTLVNALMYHCGSSLSGINGIIRPGIVHRIDKDTTGLLMVAKSDAAHKGLAEQIKDHSFTREYAALVVGHFKEQVFTVRAPIGRHPVDRKKMCVTTLNSREAITHIQVLQELRGFSYIKCTLETGRTHQIRVHTAYMGHPVAGDEVYGHGAKLPLATQGQCLHAKTIGFVHPITNQKMYFTSDLPAYFKELLDKIPH